MNLLYYIQISYYNYKLIDLRNSFTLLSLADASRRNLRAMFFSAHIAKGFPFFEKIEAQKKHAPIKIAAILLPDDMLVIEFRRSSLVSP